MNKIYDNGNIPIIVGGTGFYIRAITHDIEFEEINKDTSLRDEDMFRINEKIKDLEKQIVNIIEGWEFKDRPSILKRKDKKWKST